MALTNNAATKHPSTLIVVHILMVFLKQTLQDVVLLVQRLMKLCEDIDIFWDRPRLSTLSDSEVPQEAVKQVNRQNILMSGCRPYSM